MKAPAGYDLVSIEARDKVDGWSPRARELFTELLEDAPSELQRELLNRAVAAGHSSAEVHAFADALRGLSDAGAFDACTIERDSAPDCGVVQLLKAEGDPLFAFKLKGGELSPTEAPALAVTDKLPPYAPPGAAGRARPGFDAQDTGQLKRSADKASRDLGASPDVGSMVRSGVSGSGSNAAVLPPSAGPVIVQDLLNEAAGTLGLVFREQPVDGPGQLKLEDALVHAAQALQKGLPVPVVLGPQPGSDRRLALMLQCQASGKSRAYQLLDVLSQEIAWINEGDLIARAELPFASKANRRITRIALPTSRSF